MINDTPNHRYFYLTGYFKSTLNERASSVMPPTNFDCDLCSSINDKFRDLAYLHRQRPYNFSREIWFEYFNRKESYGLPFSWEHSDNSFSLGFQLALETWKTITAAIKMMFLLFAIFVLERS